MKTKIEWADITINPIVGCSKCSPGCDHCYAERFAARLAKNPATAKKYAGVVDKNGKWTGKINEEGWGSFDTLPHTPKRIFLGSMTDIFHENVPEVTIEEIFWNIKFMWRQHTFLLLTKRPRNAQKFIKDCPLPQNAWLGVTVCNQAEADAKIPVLLDIPAAKRFVSVEPMLGPVQLSPFLVAKHRATDGALNLNAYMNSHPSNSLDWVICGGETGPGARPMHPIRVRSLRDQCQAAGVPFFFKGWGEWVTENQSPEDIVLPGHSTISHGWKGRKYEDIVYRVGKSRSGRLLDGRTWDEIPEANR